MAKYCVKCGAELDAHDKFCENCGVKLEVMEDTGVTEPQKNAGKQMKKNNVFKITGVVALIAIVVVAAVLFIPKGNTPEKVIEKTIAACKYNDSDVLTELSAGEYSTYDPYVVSEVINGFMYTLGDLEDCEVTYEIIDSHAVDTEETLAPLFRKLDIYYYIGMPPVHDFSDVEETVVYNVKINALQDGKAVDMEKEITLVKESGSWRLLNVE